MEGDAAHHLGHVLRAQSGQLYELSDGSAAWLSKIESVARHRIEFSLLEQLPAQKPAADTTLLLSVVKFDAFEWAIEKATELGVTRIIPVAAARSEKGLLAAAAKRSQRWQKILLEASQQSRRLRVPQLDELIRTTLNSLNGAKPATAALAIGPEGGWTDEELSAARAAGFQEASLGQLILRTETAVIAALATLNFSLSPE